MWKAETQDWGFSLVVQSTYWADKASKIAFLFFHIINDHIMEWILEKEDNSSE